jgi:dephospho-CoA kinase
VARLLKRGLTKDQITKRIQAQATDSEREVIADLIIKNEKSQEELFTQVEKLWELLQSKNKAK